MKEFDLFYLGCVGLVFILLIFIVFQNIIIKEVEKKNKILKGIIDKLTNENVRLIEELYESNIDN